MKTPNRPKADYNFAQGNALGMVTIKDFLRPEGQYKYILALQAANHCLPI